MDDPELARAILDGDRAALRLLLDRETPPLLRACTRILGDPDEAADVVQETFIAAIDALPGYRGDAGLRSWLMRIAIRRAIRRAIQRRSPAPDRPIDGIELVDAGSPDPDADILRAERDRRLRDAVAALPDPYRDAIALRFFGELDLAAIAAAIGAPVETVRTRIRRGLMRLRVELAGEVAA